MYEYSSLVKDDVRPQRRLSLTLERPSRENFYDIRKPGLWSLTPYHTQNYTFARWSVADIFKCNEPTIRRNKQLPLITVTTKTTTTTNTTTTITIQWLWSASELYRPSDRCFSAKLVPTSAGRGCRVVDLYGRNLAFQGQSRYFFFQVVPQLYSWDWVEPRSRPATSQKIW
jgi:hypothetical protein